MANVVSYYTSQANADSGTNPVSSASYIGTNNTVIYVRIQNSSDPNCYVTTSFTLFVVPLLPVDTHDDVIVCENYTLQPLTNGNYFTGANGTGTPLFAGDVITETQVINIYNTGGGDPNCSGNTSFKITVIDPATMSPTDVVNCGSYSLPPVEYGQYFTQPGGQGQQIPFNTSITSSQIVYYYYMADTTPSCVVDSPFNVTIFPAVDAGNHQDVFDCSSYVLPALSSGHYYTLPNGGGSEIAAGTVIDQTQTIYVFVESGTTPNCTDSDNFDVVIGYENPGDIIQCEPYVLPQLAAGSYFTGPHGTGNPIAAGTSITGTQTIYVYINGNGNCVVDVNFSVEIGQPPVDSSFRIKPFVPVTLCRWCQTDLFMTLQTAAATNLQREMSLLKA